MGNSEVGHLNIGSGRIINQELTRIDCAIEDDSIASNEVLLAAFESAATNDKTVHFMGLLSDGGVHSMQNHLEALAVLAAKNHAKHIRIHAFLDGRDVAPTSGKSYIERAIAFCKQLEADHPGLDARIGVISGRYFAMDRDNRWDRVQKAWDALVGTQGDGSLVFCNTREPSPCVLSSAPENVEDWQGKGSNASSAAKRGLSEQASPSPADPAVVVQASYDAGITDEFVEPVNTGGDTIQDGDSIIFFNFRPDRARELTRAFIDPNFDGFERNYAPKVTYVCMTEYDATFERDFDTRVAFPKSFPTNVLADYLASLGLKQLHIAETEKYAHVTFFFNGGVEEPKAGEQRVLIPSPKVATYDLQPEMSAPGVTKALVEAIESDAADVYIVNYANGDMVGHTGVLPATIAAIEAVDAGLKQVLDAIVDKGGVALVTADHGNSEQMTAADGSAWTAHTLAPVPLAVIEAGEKTVDLERERPARLADIAPTLLDLMSLPIPEEWTGRSLLIHA
jgi:2,3-bisphosphoglycerate-independent phosphoglycerate mutase